VNRAARRAIIFNAAARTMMTMMANRRWDHPFPLLPDGLPMVHRTVQWMDQGFNLPDGLTNAESLDGLRQESLEVPLSGCFFFILADSSEGWDRLFCL